MKDSEQVVNCDFWLWVVFGFFKFWCEFGFVLFICLEQWEKCMSMVYCTLFPIYLKVLKSLCNLCYAIKDGFS